MVDRRTCQNIPILPQRTPVYDLLHFVWLWHRLTLLSSPRPSSRAPPHVRRCCIVMRAWESHHHHHWAAIVSPVWAKASACRLQVRLSCAVLCQIVSLQFLFMSSLHCWAGLPCRLFSSCGDTRGPSVVFEAVDVKCHSHDHFFSHC